MFFTLSICFKRYVERTLHCGRKIGARVCFILQTKTSGANSKVWTKNLLFDPIIRQWDRKILYWFG